MLPKIIKNFNAFFEDESWAGTFDEVTVGKLERIKNDFRGATMGAAVKIDMGYVMPEISMTIKEYNSKLIKAWGEPDIDGTQLRLKATARSDSPGQASQQIEIVFRGRPGDIDLGSWKTGEFTDTKLTFCPAYLLFKINGETLVELDPINGVEEVGGIDRFEDARAFL